MKNNDDKKIKYNFDFLNDDIKLGYLDLNVEDMSSKQYTYIFARNGVGKTTYTRRIKNDQAMVFNKDYVSKNIYVSKLDKNTQETKAEQDTLNQSSSFKIFIGEGIHDINKKHIAAEADYNNAKELLSKKISINENIIKSKNFNIKPPTQNSISINRSKLKDVDNDKIKNLNSKIKSYDDYDLSTTLKNKINALIDMSNVIKDKIDSYNNISMEVYSGEDEDVVKIHKQAFKIEKPWKFIDIDVDRNLLEKHIEKINDIKLKPSDEINRLIKNIKEDIQKDSKLFETYEDQLLREKFKTVNNIYKDIVMISPKSVDPVNSIEFLNKIEIDNRDSLKELIHKIIENETIELLQDPLELKKLADDLQEKDEIRKQLVTQIKEKTKEISEETAERINAFLHFFAVDDMKVKFKTSLKQNKDETLILDFENGRNLDKLSEGELSIFSFCYFLTDVEYRANSENRDLAIVIDDPFDSNDHTKIFKFKDIPFIYRKKEVKSFGGLQLKYNEDKEKQMKIVLLTHNIQVIYSMISSLKEEIKSGEKFNKIKFSDKIEIREWIKSGTKVRDDNILASSFFPRDELIRDGLYRLVYNLIDLDVSPNESYSSFRLLWYLILRISEDATNLRSGEMYDESQRLRGKLKEIIQNQAWGDSYVWDMSKAKEHIEFFLRENLIDLEITPIHNERIDDILNVISTKLGMQESVKFEKEILSIELFKKSGFNDDDTYTMIRYLKRFSNYLMVAYKDKMPDTFRRLRHKEYLYSSIIAYSLEEF